MSSLLTAAVAAVAVLFVLLMIGERRRWRAYRRASQALVDKQNVVRPAEVAGRADTPTDGGLKMRSTDTNGNGRAT